MAKESRFPSATQQAFLLVEAEHALFGGAAGGGKSSAMLGAALQYVDVPGYAAGIFRRKYTDLNQPDALVPRSHEWLAGTDAHWQGDQMQWRFPSGAVLKFGYMDGGRDHLNYQGAAFQFVGYEEAGQLQPVQMEYLQTRARRLEGASIPIRFRYTANPGGEAHEWLVRNFLLEGPSKGWVFIPSFARDNPGLDVADYLKRMERITDPVLRAQLLEGDWAAQDRTGLVVPEFDAACEAYAVVESYARPPFFAAYAGVDVGSRDLTVFLFAYLDFVQGCLVVEDERVYRNPSTQEMVDGVKEAESTLWGAARESGACVGVRRYTDVDLRLVRDMARDGIDFTPTQKQAAEVHERACRADVRAGKVRIHPRCQTLLRTLRFARYNDSRSDYERTPETGHADAWKALVYMHRNVRWEDNPFPRTPLGHGFSHRAQAQHGAQQSEGARLAAALGLGRRR